MKIRKMLVDLKKRFQEHPHSVGETYLMHLWFAFLNGSRIAAIGVCLWIHGIFPFLFRDVASTEMKKLSDILVKRKHKG